METIKWVQGIIAFVKVAELRSFSKAADALGVSKSHISKTIKALEQDLGVALFSRSTRKIQLTSVGSEFLESAKSSLEKLEWAKKDIINLAEHPRGLLRVTVAGIFGEEYIAPVAIALSAKYPDLRIELHFDSRIVDLIEEKFDIAIRFGHLQDSALLAQKIATRREHVCVSPSYLKAFPRIKEPQDLSSHNCMGDRAFWGFRQKSKILQVPVKGRFKTNNPRVLKQAALEGLGVVRLPGAYVSEDIEAGRLVPILEEYSEGTKDIWAVTPNRHEQNINVKTFITEVKAALALTYAKLNQ